MSEFKLPTETVELPSKGLLYPENSELSKGTVEIKYMTAKEEDILTNQSYIKDGVVLDKLLKSVVISEINFDDLLIGDKNALMIATRILGYGSKYNFEYNGEQEEIDLSLLENKKLEEELFQNRTNEFSYTLPFSKNEITFKILTHKDEKMITREIEGLKKINKNNVPELTTRLKYIITSIEGKRDTKDIRNFIDNYLLAKDSRSLRECIRQIQPDVDLTFFPNDSENRSSIPISVNFFWPDA